MNKKVKKVKKGKFWTEAKLEVLQAYLKEGMTYSDISDRMGKSVDSIDHTIRRYKLIKNKTPKITAKEVKAAEARQQTISALEILDSKYFEQLKKKAKIDWDIKKTKVKENKNDKGFLTYLVTSDYHVPEQDNVALKAIFYMMDDFKFDGHINLGDFMDMGCISHWNKTKKLTSEGMKLQQDYIIGNTILDEFDKRLPKDCDKHFMFGNHEDWYNLFIENNPMLEGMLDPKNELHLEKRGYKVYEKYNDSFAIGKLHFTHGIYCGLHYVKKHLDETSTNIMFGHLHQGRVRFKSSHMKELALAGYALGCLCNMSPAYMKNRPNAWTQGFGIVHFYPNGDFDVQLPRILRGKFVFNNKVYDGTR